MANTYKAIATVTVGSGGASSIDFTSIPATYTDLCLKFSLRGTVSAVGDNIKLNINSKGVDMNSSRNLYGNGSSASSTSSSSGSSGDIFAYPGSTATSSTFGNGEMYIPNYAGSNNKSIYGDSVSENNATLAYAFLNAILWSYTEAITSIVLTPRGGGSWTQYSTATLYGIKNS